MISTSMAFLSRPAPAAASAIFWESVDGPGMRAARGGVVARTGFLKTFVVAFFVTEIKPRRAPRTPAPTRQPGLLAGKPGFSLPHLGPASRESSDPAAGAGAASVCSPVPGGLAVPASFPSGAASGAHGVTCGGSYSGGGVPGGKRRPEHAANVATIRLRASAIFTARLRPQRRAQRPRRSRHPRLPRAPLPLHRRCQERAARPRWAREEPRLCRQLGHHGPLAAP